MRLNNKTGYIFDVDGTLYSQRKVRRYMFFKLLMNVFTSIHGIKEIVIIMKFRKMRERDDYKKKSVEELCQLLSGGSVSEKEFAMNTIDRWMFNEPLSAIKKYKYSDVTDFIEAEKSLGKEIIIYSDYPAKDKLDVMGINADKVYAPGQDGINELKPSKDAMEIIIKNASTPVNSFLYIGDRDIKDGQSARIIGMDYCHIDQFRKYIRNRV